MKLKEFLERIREIEQEVERDSFLCTQIQHYLGYGASKVFIRHFKPFFKDEGNLWFGSPCEENVPKRLEVLAKFKIICIRKEYYKNFEGRYYDA